MTTRVASAPGYPAGVTYRQHTQRVALIAGMLVTAALGCSSSRNQPPARTAGQCIEKGAKTGVAGAKTGVVTGVEGVKTFGKAVGGFVEGGSDEARREWQEGKQQTRAKAREGAADVRTESHAKECQ